MPISTLGDDALLMRSDKYLALKVFIRSCTCCRWVLNISRRMVGPDFLHKDKGQLPYSVFHTEWTLSFISTPSF